MDTLAIAVEEQNGTAQSICLRFHEKNKTSENFRKRRISGDHFQNATLIEKEKLFLFDLGDVAANDDAARQLDVSISEGAAIDARPQSIGRLLVPDEDLNVIYLFAPERSLEGQLVLRKRSNLVGQIKPVLPRLFARGKPGRAPAEHPLRRRI